MLVDVDVAETLVLTLALELVWLPEELVVVELVTREAGFASYQVLQYVACWTTFWVA
jgi:hypothetical protein